MSGEDLSAEELRRRLTTRTAELAAAQLRAEALQQKVRELEAEKRELKDARQALRAERTSLQRSRQFRIGKFLLNPFTRLFPHLRYRAPVPVQKMAEQRLHPLEDYAAWRLLHLPTAAELQAMREEAASWSDAPQISILMPVFNTPLALLEAAIASVRAQVYPRWELVIADDASTAPEVAARLREWQAQDERIRVDFLLSNGGIARATNAALALAQGEFVSFLDHDDWLEPHALFETACALRAQPDVDFVYSDEDKVASNGTFEKPFFKPDWSPDLLLSFNYLCHFSTIRRSLLDQIGGCREGFNGAQDFDLFLRATEQARIIVHVPKVLYHWRVSATSTSADSSQKPAAIENGRRALAEALQRCGLDAEVVATQGARYRVKYPLRTSPKITILIPTKDRLHLLARCLESIEQRTDYPNYEIVVLDNDSSEPETLAYFAQMPHRILRYDGPFNYAAICNYGARRTDGEFLLFLNNDIETIQAEWLSAMAEHIQRPEIGAVGARLLFPDDTVQHGGVVLGSFVATHAFYGSKRGSFANGGQLQVIGNYSAVTAACLLTRREVFEEIGGFDELKLAVSYNDVDFCLRIRERGYRIVYTPHATLYHFESQSRGRDKPNPAEADYMRERWPDVLAHDPYFNENLWRKVLAPE